MILQRLIRKRQLLTVNRACSALLLQPETRALLDIDVRGHTVEAEQGLADFRNSNCAFPSVCQRHVFPDVS